MVGNRTLTCLFVCIILAVICGCGGESGDNGGDFDDAAAGVTRLRDVRTDAAFIDVTRTNFSPAPEIFSGPGLALFDYDNDGDIDIFVGNFVTRPNHLYQNDGTGQFREVADEAGIRFRGDDVVCTGVGDFDNDGWLDLVIGRQFDSEGIATDAGIRFLKNIGPDEEGVVRFADATEQSGLNDVDFAASIGVGDIDNDGLLDLYIGRYDFRDLVFPLDTQHPDTPNVLLHNTGVSDFGVPVFEDITESAGVAGTALPGLAPETADIFARIPTWAVYFSDVNEDGWQDIFALQDIHGGIDLFLNNGDLTFSTALADRLHKHGGWMGIAGGDYNRDGHIDYFLANVGADAHGLPVETDHLTSAFRRPEGTPFHFLLVNDGRGDLVDRAGEIPVAEGALPPMNEHGGTGLAAYEFGFGSAFLDVQNDGWLDLTWTGDFVLFDGGGDPDRRVDFNGVGRMLISDANPSGPGFIDRTAELGMFAADPDAPLAFGFNRMGRALAAADLNGDGFPDICRTHFTVGEAFECLFNPAVGDGHWLTVRLRGSASNRFGVGARVELRAGTQIFVGEVVTTTSAFAAVHPQAHFGLGSVERLDAVTVRWPSGAVSELTDVPVDQVLQVEE